MSVSNLPAAAPAPRDYVVLVAADRFTRFGFWKPGMQAVHASVWDELHSQGLRFWSDATREIKVHPDDYDAAQAVMLCVERNAVDGVRMA